MFFTDFVLCILRLFKLKTEGKTMALNNLAPLLLGLAKSIYHNK